MKREELEKLRVVDLKAELKARGIMCSGRKDELIERLLNAEKEKNEQGGEQEKEKGEKIQEEPSKKEEATAIDTQKNEGTNQKKADVPPTAENVPEKPKEPKKEEPPKTEAKETRASKPTKEPEVAKPKTEASLPEFTKTEPQKDETTSTSQEKPEKKEDSKKEHKQEEQQKTEGKGGVLAPEQKDSKGTRLEKEGLSKDEMESENDEEDKLEKRKRERDERKESDTNNSAKKTRVTEATNVLHIIGFVRPFSKSQLEEYLSGNGKRKLKDQWMNEIKSHGYFVYENVEDAEQSKNEIHGNQWPPQTGRILHVDFAKENDIERAKTINKTKTNQTVAKNSFRTNGPNVYSSNPNLGTNQPVSNRNLQFNNNIPNRNSRYNNSSSGYNNPPASESGHAEESEVKDLTLDELFKKTKARPHIYWKSVDENTAKQREEFGKREKRRR